MPGEGIGGVAVSGGVVVVGSRDILDSMDVWLALDADTGQERWRVVYPAPGQLDYGNSPRATPTISGKVAYLFGAMGHLYAVALDTGKILWTRLLSLEYGTPRLEWGLAGTPIVADGKLVVQPGGREANIVALDLKTGETLWSSAGGKPGHASLVLRSVGPAQLVGYDVDSLGGWSLDTGERLWRVPPKVSGDFNVPTPILVGDRRLLVATENNGTRLYEFDDQGRLSAKPIASSNLIQPDSHTPVLSDGRLYGVYAGLVCLDVNDQLRERWTLEEDGLDGYASLIASGRRILILNDRAELILVEDRGDAGAILGRLILSDAGERTLSHPALAGGALFLRLGTTLARFELSSADSRPQ